MSARATWEISTRPASPGSPQIAYRFESRVVTRRNWLFTDAAGDGGRGSPQSPALVTGGGQRDPGRFSDHNMKSSDNKAVLLPRIVVVRRKGQKEERWWAACQAEKRPEGNPPPLPPPHTPQVAPPTALGSKGFRRIKETSGRIVVEQRHVCMVKNITTWSDRLTCSPIGQEQMSRNRL